MQFSSWVFFYTHKFQLKSTWCNILTCLKVFLRPWTLFVHYIPPFQWNKFPFPKGGILRLVFTFKVANRKMYFEVITPKSSKLNRHSFRPFTAFTIAPVLHRSRWLIQSSSPFSSRHAMIKASHIPCIIPSKKFKQLSKCYVYKIIEMAKITLPSNHFPFTSDSYALSWIPQLEIKIFFSTFFLWLHCAATEKFMNRFHIIITFRV